MHGRTSISSIGDVYQATQTKMGPNNGISRASIACVTDSTLKRYEKRVLKRYAATACRRRHMTNKRQEDLGHDTEQRNTARA